MDQDNKVILLAGPTASGKSKLALKLAQRLNGEIINADSMQVYKEFSILTSRPGKKDIKKIKHHLYGFNSVKKNFSTGYWLKNVIKKINEQRNRRKTPIIVGGTGLYFKALTKGLVKIPDIPTDLRQEIRKIHEKIGQKFFFTKLTRLDPLAKKFLQPSDSQRSIRAYEVKKFTNKSFFDFLKETKSYFDEDIFVKLFINTPKELLHHKIEQRVEKMFDEGVVKEIEKFLGMNIKKDLSSNKIIGVKEVKDYIEGKSSLTKTKELIKQKTRQYAKRQFTWARGHMKSWKMIYSPNINDLFKKSLNKIF